MSGVSSDGRLLNFIGDRFRHLGSQVAEHDVFAFAYAVLSSTEYRRRFSAFLKAEFPRIPSRPAPLLFANLVTLGWKLIRLHANTDLGEDGALKAAQPGVADGGTRALIPRGSSAFLEKKAIAWRDCGVSIGDGIRVEGISEEVWNYHAGGYRVCDKWLRSRSGIRISQQLVDEFLAVVSSVKSTLLVMKEIDIAIGSGDELFIEDLLI